MYAHVYLHLDTEVVASMMVASQPTQQALSEPKGRRMKPSSPQSVPHAAFGRG